MPGHELTARVDDLVEAARHRDWVAIDEHLGRLMPGFHMRSLGHLQVTRL